MMLPVPWQPAMNDIYNYDAITFTRHLPAQSVQCVVTSPPYFGLRDYGVDGQWGLEPTIEKYVGNLVALFREIRRALADDGTVWLNLGDSYSTGGGNRKGSGVIGIGREGIQLGGNKVDGLPDKNLIGIPWRVALALQADGWYLRSDIIWHKPAPMPESVTDRPTRAHEYIFLLTKSGRYYYDADAIKEQGGDWGARDRSNYKYGCNGRNETGIAKHTGLTKSYTTRNKRTVWSINTHSFPDAHFAVFPPELPRLCIRAGSRPGDVVYDPFTGSGTTALVAREEDRHYIGCDVNPDYVAMARKRLSQSDPFQPTVTSINQQNHIQMSLFG